MLFTLQIDLLLQRPLANCSSCHCLGLKSLFNLRQWMSWAEYQAKFISYFSMWKQTGSQCVWWITTICNSTKVLSSLTYIIIRKKVFSERRKEKACYSVWRCADSGSIEHAGARKKCLFVCMFFQFFEVSPDIYADGEKLAYCITTRPLMHQKNQTKSVAKKTLWSFSVASWLII